MRALTLLVFFLVAACGGSKAAPEPAEPVVEVVPPDAGPPAEAEAEAGLEPERRADVESFDKVWTTIRDKHFDETLGGLDWQAVRDELRPKVIAAGTRDEVRKILEEMLGRLEQSHFGIIPGSAYEVMQSGGAGEDTEQGDGVVGVDLRIDEGGAPVVTAVEKGSPAAKAKVKAGWIIKRIGEDDLIDVLAKVRAGLPEGPMAPAYLTGAAVRRLDGPVGSKVSVVFLDGKDKEVAVELERVAPSGKVVSFGNLPAMPIRYESRRIGKDVGYIALSAFFDPAEVMKSFAADIKGFGDARGIIVDLRGNPGGLGAMAMGMGGWFVTEPNLSLGTMITRDTELEFVLNPQPDPYSGPVAILIDELSMSTSEIMAAGLQDLGRARIFGRPSPGAALPSVIEKLPNGDGFQYAFANYISAGGKAPEGHGVVPDELVPIDRQALLSGKDPALEAAVTWIRSQPKTNQPSQKSKKSR